MNDPIITARPRKPTIKSTAKRNIDNETIIEKKPLMKKVRPILLPTIT